MKTSESHEQQALFTWAMMQSGKYPELNMMFAIPNGGNRNIREAAKLKREGVKAGVSDIFLSVARNGHHGFYIEMKVGKNKPTDKQKVWLEMAEKERYCTAVCYSFEEAKERIERYLGIK